MWLLVVPYRCFLSCPHYFDCSTAFWDGRTWAKGEIKKKTKKRLLDFLHQLMQVFFFFFFFLRQLCLLTAQNGFTYLLRLWMIGIRTPPSPSPPTLAVAAASFRWTWWLDVWVCILVFDALCKQVDLVLFLLFT